MNTNIKRLEWIDLLRATAILMVVLCHSIEGIYDFSTKSILSLSKSSRTFAFLFFSIGRLGVPMFLMISGYLLLDRDYDASKCKRFWKNNWLHLLICTEIWFILYNLFLLAFNNEPITFEYMIEELLFVKKVNLNHVWYMPMIIGMYLLFPYVSKALKAFELKNLRLPIIVFMLYAFIYPFAQTIIKAYDMEPLAMQMSLGFSGGSYGIYFITGYLVKKDCFVHIKSRYLVVLAAISFVGTVIFQLWVYNQESSYMVWYNNPLLFICSVSLFILFSRLQRIVLYKVIYFLSYYSFAVYLIHNIVKTMILPDILDMSCRLPAKVAIVWTLVVIISFPVALIIRYIPKIGKYILYLK